MKLMKWIDNFFNKLLPAGPPPSQHLLTTGFTGERFGAEFKDASWEIYTCHCVAVGQIGTITFLGGAVVAGDYKCDVWQDGEFYGNRLDCFKWQSGIFRGKHLDCGHWNDANGECQAETVELDSWSGKACRAKRIDIDHWSGGLCEAKVAEIGDWEDGVFRGGTLAVGSWHGGTFEGDTFHGKWYGGVWKGRHFKGIDLSEEGLEMTT